MFENKEKHKSYGMMSFNRRTSSGEFSLFGSSIKHRDIIAMTLRRAEVNRELEEDWFLGDEIIAEVEMSYSQFAEVIASMNMGCGVPVTIRYTETDGCIEECPFTSKLNQLEDEFSEHINESKQKSSELIEDVKNMFDSKKSFTKKDKEEIIKRLQALETHIGSNTEFIYRQFNRQVEKTITEAKGEIECFYQNKINSIAQERLVEDREKLNSFANSIDLQD